MMQKYVLIQCQSRNVKKKIEYFKRYYGMVGDNEGTATIDEKTVVFLNAVEHLKEYDGVVYGVIEDKIGLKKNTISMMKAGRRKVKGFEVDNLINKYPETSTFFNQDPPAQTQEPMQQYHNGGAAKKLIERQEELIEMLKDEVKRLKDELDLLKTETEKLKAANKVLTEIVTKNNQK